MEKVEGWSFVNVSEPMPDIMRFSRPLGGGEPQDVGTGMQRVDSTGTVVYRQGRGEQSAAANAV